MSVYDVEAASRWVDKIFDDVMKAVSEGDKYLESDLRDRLNDAFLAGVARGKGRIKTDLALKAKGGSDE